MSYITIPLLFVMLSGCEGIALREQQMAAAGAFDGCGCVAKDCGEVRAFSGKAAAIAAGKSTSAVGARVTQ